MIDIIKYWNNQQGRVRINDMLSTISNGFIIDFRRDGIWNEITEPDRTKDTFSYSLTDCKLSVYLMSEGKGGNDYGIGEEPLFLYRYETAYGQHIFLQKQYCEYFRRLYPDCEFFGKEPYNPGEGVAIHYQGELVGAIMPVLSTVPYRVVRDFNPPHLEGE